MIEHLSELYEPSAGTGITFVYCNYKESRTALAYMRLALKQLFRTMQHIPPELQKVYEHCYDNDRQPKYDELKNAFLAIMRQFGCVFFILDALDECTPDQRKTLTKFILGIADTTSTSTGQEIVKFFVTSRKESDIEQAFQQQFIPTIEVETAKVNDDIRIYVKAQIDLRLQDGSLSLRNTALKDKIFRTITTRAGGMYVIFYLDCINKEKVLINTHYRFLWVEFQLDAICAEISDKGIEQALERLPDDMDKTYERILETINKKPRAQRELARRILIWTTYSLEPLLLEDLAYVISFERDAKSLKDLKSSAPTEKIILNACAHLISIDQKYRVQFVHFSVREFLTSTSHRSTNIEDLGIGYEAAHRELAQTCMIFPTLFPKEKDFLGWYASNEWPRHLLAANLNSLPVNNKIIALTLSFLEKSPMILTHRQFLIEHEIYLQFSPPVLALIFDLPGQEFPPLCEKQLDEEQFKTIHPLEPDCLVLSDDRLAYFAAVELNSVPVAQRLYSHGFAVNYSYCGPEGENTKGLASLQISPLYSVLGISMAKFLLDNGISMEPQLLYNRYIDPLKYFVKKGNWGIDILELLLDRVVDPDGERLVDALRAAIMDNSIEVVQLFLDKGVANTFILGEGHGNILQIAAYKGRIEIIRRLVEKGMDVNAQGGEYGNALQAAAYMGKAEVVQLLLDKGADVNSQGGKYGSALQAAVLNGKVEVIRQLLEKGVDVNIHAGEYGTALQAAAYTGKAEVIQLLLDKGADITANGGRYGNSLQAAALKCEAEVIKLMLDKGVDVNIQGGQYGNALQAAAHTGSVEVLQLLLDNGADVHAQGGLFGNALQAAASEGNVEVIQLLLNKGANVNIQGGYALQAATYHGRTEAIGLLLDAGADLNAQSKFYGNALEAAARGGKIEALRLLLDKGAGSNARSGTYDSILQSAVYTGKVELIQLLLDNGADVNAQDGIHRSALQTAALLGKVEVIRLLLDNGADVNAQGGEFGSAMQAAALAITDQVEAIQLLLDKGGDVHAQGGKYGNALQAAAYCREVEVIQLLLDKGADVNAQGGIYGTSLQAALAPDEDEFEPRGRKTLKEIFSVTELLLDRGAVITTYVPDSKYGNALNAVKQLWEEDRDSLDGLMKILASRGWNGDEAESNMAEASQGLKKNGFGASMHVWKLFVFTFLVFLLYAVTEFWI